MAENSLKSGFDTGFYFSNNKSPEEVSLHLVFLSRNYFKMSSSFLPSICNDRLLHEYKVAAMPKSN